MATKAKRGGLGKGLEALFVDNTTEDIAPATLKITEVEPNQGQPRQDFDETALSELADSIREHGVLQPLLVRPMPNGRYQLVAGERRWRASRMAGLSEVPVVIREMTDTQSMEFALIENLQREDLNIIEEALGYRTLMEEHGYTQEQVAQRVGKSRPVIANALRMLGLPKPIEKMVRSGQLTPGHGRAILAFQDEKLRLEMANRILKQGLSVREVERLASQQNPKKSARQQQKGEQESSWGDSYYKEMELALAEELHRKVRVTVEKEKNQGTLEIEFYSREEFNDIIQRLANNH